MKVTIYVEGGTHGTANTSSIGAKCRKGFTRFFQNASFSTHKCMPKIVACGGRQQAYDDFCLALENAKPDEFPVLLVDSETIVSEPSKWAHLKKRQGDDWSKPEGATEEHVYLMSVCMESWLLADKAVLKQYYGQNFNENALPKNSNLENIDKKMLYDGFKKATQATQKGNYSKGSHSFEILGQIDPKKVMSGSSMVKALICQLKCKLNCADAGQGECINYPC